MRSRIILFFTLFLIYLFPIGVLYYISESEQKNYMYENNVVIQEKSYGTTFPVERVTIDEYLTVDVVGVSTEYLFQELDKSSEIKWLVNKGDEVFKGDIIAKQQSQEIISKYNGIVKEIKGAGIKILSFDETAWECYVNKEDLKYFNQSVLLDRLGNKVNVLRISNQILDGKVKVIFKLSNEKCVYGQKKKDFKLYTGNRFENVLAVSSDCVYEKKGEYYVRTIDEAGNFLSEVQVEKGYVSVGFTCVTGVAEGTLCDAGYKSYIEDMVEE